MNSIRATLSILFFIGVNFFISVVYGQCPSFPTASIVGNEDLMCEGEMLTISLSGQNIPPGSSVNFYMVEANENPYQGFGSFIGSVPVNMDIIPNFVWTVPSTFCETYGTGIWYITGILNPAPTGGCPEIFTPYFGFEVSCSELFLSGGGDVCEGNCPAAPNSIIFSLAGNSVPFTADIVVSSSAFPSFNINDLEITNGQELFICLEGFLPSFDPVTNTLTVPIFAIGLSATVQIVSLIDASGCTVTVDPTSVILNFIEAPTADAGPDMVICSHEEAALTGSIGGSATMAQWITGGDGVFDNSQSLSAIYTPGSLDIQNETVILTLLSTDVNGACTPASSSLQLTIEPSMIIEMVSPMTICNTDEAVIMAMITGPAEPGMWETDGDGTFLDPTNQATIYIPGNNDISNGLVTLYYFPTDPDVCVAINEPLLVYIVDAPEVVVPFVIEVCEDDTVSIEITVTGNFTNISWSAMGDGILDVITNTFVTYTPGPQDVDDQFTIVSVVVLSGFAECGQTTYNIAININDCGCAPFETIPPDEAVCSDNDILDLSSLLVIGGTGTWSISGTPGGPDPAIVLGDDFITNTSDPGIYTVSYTLNSPEPGCPISSSEMVEVIGQVTPDAGTDITNCGPGTVLINGTFSPFGITDILWESLGDGIFTDEFNLSTSYTAGPVDSISNEVKIVLHVIIPGCEEQTDTVNIIYEAMPFAFFPDDTFNICNEEDKGSIMNFYSLITGGDASGIWINSGGAPVDFSNPAMVNFDGVAEGYYAFQYQTNSAVFPCPESSYTIIIHVEDCLCPLIQVQPLPGGVCNNIQQINLAAFITAGAPGSWQIMSMPPGSNPAVVNGPILETGGADQGNYNLRFTFDSAPIDGCPDSAEISVFIQALPTISIGNDTTVCGIADIPLQAVIGGSAINGEWKTSGTGTFENNVQLNTIYTPSLTDLASGIVRIMGQTAVSLSFCPDGFDTLLLSLVTPPSTDWSSPGTTICNQPDSGSIVNFLSFITGGDLNGLWTDEDGSNVDLSDLSQVDFNGINAGVYQFSYLTQSALPPCQDISYLFMVTVEECACPPFLFGSIDDIICSPASFDLNALIIDAAAGSWSIRSGPVTGTWPLIISDSLITTNASPGDYNLAYELTDSIPDCTATKFIPFTIENIPTLIISGYNCSAADMTYSISFTSDAEIVNADFGLITEPSNGYFLIAGIPSSQDILIELTSLSGSCQNMVPYSGPDCNCTLITEEISDTILLCPGDTFVLIPFLTGAQGLAFSTWVSEDETLMRPTLPLFEPGTWIWILRDSVGCETRDTFDVAFRELIVIEALTLGPTCNGLADGSIIISDIDGGSGPYIVRLDNEPSFISNTWPDTLNDISAGNHSLMVSNADGCETKLSLFVDDISEGSVDLGPDLTIPLGDSVFLDPQLINITGSLFDWSPITVDPGTQNFWFTPSETVLIHLIMTDSIGCMYKDEVLIRVFVEQFFYVPNAFSPNGDQANDLFQVFDSGDDIIESVEIFDRWGNQVFVKHGGAPFIWDGMIRNQPAMGGVYVVKVVWRDEKGKSKIYTRDLTVIR